MMLDLCDISVCTEQTERSETTDATVITVAPDSTREQCDETAVVQPVCFEGLTMNELW